MSLKYLLEEQNFKTCIEAKPEAVTYEQFLSMVPADKYFVALRSFNRVLIGKWENNTFKFANNEHFEAEDIVELRIFNEKLELLLKREGNNFKMRSISDFEGKKSVGCVDSSSELFGKLVDKYDENAEFLYLYEEGRKIGLYIPNVGKSENGRYRLVTRSYIDFDNDTSQAGFSCYRYLGIDKEVVNNGNRG